MFRAVVYCFKYKAIMPNKLGSVRMYVFLSICTWPLCVCFNIMGFIRRNSGRHQQGRGMWLVSLFYSIALLIHNLKYQDYGGAWSAVVWWEKKWIPRSASVVSPGQARLVSGGEKWKPREKHSFCLGFLYWKGNAPKGKCKPVCRNKVRLYII